MTQTTNARIAGVTFLLYIALGMASMIFLNVASKIDGTAAKLASVAEHASMVKIDLLLSVLICFIAVMLAVSLFGILRDVDMDLAVLVLSCRVIEAALSVVSIFITLGLLWLSMANGPDVPDVSAAHAIASFLQKTQGWNFSVAATFFAVGSTVFSVLLVRGRLVPMPLAWLGVVASVLLVLMIPLQLVGVIGGTIGFIVWLPMLVFEVTIAFWFIIKGVGCSNRGV